MPLIPDGAYRGVHATHVHWHQKLGRHRTVITVLLPLVNQIIDRWEVTQVDLGKLAGANSGASFTRRIRCEVKGRRVQLLLVCEHAAQAIGVVTRTETMAVTLALQITAYWESGIALPERIDL